MHFQVTYMLCRRDPDAFVAGSQLQPYQLTQPIRPDAALSSLLHEQCTAAVGSHKALQGLNVTADSFYSSQVCSLSVCVDNCCHFTLLCCSKNT